MEQTFTEEKEASVSFDFGRFFTKILQNYYWFILTLAVALTLAWMYLRYTQPLYKVSTYILIEQPENPGNVIGG